MSVVASRILNLCFLDDLAASGPKHWDAMHSTHLQYLDQLVNITGEVIDDQAQVQALADHDYWMEPTDVMRAQWVTENGARLGGALRQESLGVPFPQSLEDLRERVGGPGDAESKALQGYVNKVMQFCQEKGWQYRSDWCGRPSFAVTAEGEVAEHGFALQELAAYIDGMRAYQLTHADPTQD